MKEINEIIKRLNEFREARNWKKFHTPDNLAKSISIEASELLENYQWGSQNANIDNIKDEVADVFIYLLLLCDEFGIDIIDATNKKIDINEKKYPVEKSFGNSKKYNQM